WARTTGVRPWPSSGTGGPSALFCLRLHASGVPFVRAYPTERLEPFLDSHCRAFDWLGGVYDNPKTAVVRILQGPEREEHVRFASLRAHHLFESRFCRPG
ncbi:MAG: hypothetical protein AB1609_18295, partial [Bacillota bacterium]